jgi:DNA-binding response OmpR family regulator
VNATRARRRHLLDQLIRREPISPPAAPTRVLVVDDDDVIRALITVTLSVEGFEMFGAADGRSALALRARIDTQVVILDATMPDISGYEVAAALHADQGSTPVKVLVLAGRDPSVSPAAPEVCLPPGVDARLAKPFEADELVSVVKSLARRS